MYIHTSTYMYLHHCQVPGRLTFRLIIGFPSYNKDPIPNAVANSLAEAELLACCLSSSTATQVSGVARNGSSRMTTEAALTRYQAVGFPALISVKLSIPACI